MSKPESRNAVPSRELRSDAVQYALARSAHAAQTGILLSAADLVRDADVIASFIFDGTLPPAVPEPSA